MELIFLINLFKKLNELVFYFIDLIDLPSPVVNKITDYLFNRNCYVSTD